MKLDYRMPASLDEALEILAAAGGKARVIAGGTDLMLDLQTKKYTPEHLVDVTGIGELHQVKFSEREIWLGAACTFSELAENETLCAEVPALVKAASSVGSPQTRNVATVGGNIVSAMPAADSAVPLMALDARVEVAGPAGKKLLPLGACYLGFGKSAVDPTREVVIGIRFPRPDEKTGFAVQRFAQRRSVALPAVLLAVLLRREEKTASEVRIAVGPCGVRPWRAERAENLLLGLALTQLRLIEAAAMVAADAPFRDSPVRFTAKYKKEISQAMFLDAVSDAMAQAGFHSTEA